MKIKRTTKYKNKLLKLKLIDSRIFNKNQQQNNIKIEDITYRLKKSIFVIYKYSLLKKRIVFIGMPTEIALKLQSIFRNSTKHLFIPKSIWVRGSISDKKTFFKPSTKKSTLHTNFYKTLLQLKKHIDLVVAFKETTDTEIIHESYFSRIPVISLNSNLEIKYHKPSYKVPGNFQFNNKKMRENIFYSILVTTLKKSITSKKNGFK